MSDYTPKPTPNYMSSDWGNSQTKYAALNIDHIADKAKFAIEILEASVKAFDSIEKEIVDASNATTPLLVKDCVHSHTVLIPNSNN
ncbi:hypothetical protein [Shimazuella alba]|uniref:hypothetical protein n=1 Tax=Shimazuella alba TaxID=2690964 RepID=UPI001F295D27|nr:hypothetical protein [Shimazuella alba]